MTRPGEPAASALKINSVMGSLRLFSGGRRQPCGCLACTDNEGGGEEIPRSHGIAARKIGLLCRLAAWIGGLDQAVAEYRVFARLTQVDCRPGQRIDDAT